MMYLLDTNILSELIKKQPNPHLMLRLDSTAAHSLFTSCICVMELRFGSALRTDFQQFWPKVTKEILDKVNILAPGYEEAVMAGDILASLQKKGQPIGLEDILIASTALTHKLVLVTANTRHFAKVRKLALENWLEPV
ncbi:MAG: PIN domain-containing protein [Deltaproteobacteria bacterium]|nr:PIN domain-containing protein [Deltaproteobacteria bacterium]